MIDLEERHEEVPVRDAATVMLLRDAPRFEVFMLRRNLASEFVAGAYVFPGGAVDPDDRTAYLHPVCDARTDADASRILDVDAGGLGFWVAAIRECFEEAGVLLARDRRSGAPVDFGDPVTEARFARHRSTVDAGVRSLVDVALEEDLLLDVDRLSYFSRWITPAGAPRRYDTRFFVAAAPVAQQPLHDRRETIASLWIEPKAALDRHTAGEMELIFPTLKSLETLARFESRREVLAAVRDGDPRLYDVPAATPERVRGATGG